MKWWAWMPLQISKFNKRRKLNGRKDEKVQIRKRVFVLILLPCTQVYSTKWLTTIERNGFDVEKEFLRTINIRQSWVDKLLIRNCSVRLWNLTLNPDNITNKSFHQFLLWIFLFFQSLAYLQHIFQLKFWIVPTERSFLPFLWCFSEF